MQNSIITTSSATIGGLSKLFVSGYTLGSINLNQISEVAFYAAISATIGYGLKMLFDELRVAYKRHRAQKRNRNEKRRR